MLSKARGNNILPDLKNTKIYYREVYLKSDHWKILKEEKLSKNPNCEECGTNLSLDVHHKEYRGLYDVKIRDLQTLCRLCHDNIHKKKELKDKKDEEVRIKREKKRLIKHIERMRRSENVILSVRNKKRQEIFDKTVNWNHKDMNNYISVHY